MNSVVSMVRGIERERGITHEMKRYNEIKAGINVSGVMIFLYFLMQGINSTGPAKLSGGAC